jgi:hypothetical protein
MIKRLSLLGAAAAALLLSPPLAMHSEALTGLKATADTSQGVTLVARGIRGGGLRMGGVRMGGIRHGGFAMRHGGNRAFGMRHGGHRAHAFRPGRHIGKGHFRRGYAYFPGKQFRRHHGKHFRPYRRFYAAPYVAYGAYSYSYGNCYWLRERAIVTGSSYWWQRYEACRDYWD